MPTAQEVIGAVKKERGKCGSWGLTWGKPTVDGMCQNIGTVAEELGGCQWFSPEAKAFPDQVYPGHAVGIVPSEHENSGFVIDFTAKGKVIIGNVTNISDDEQTKRELQKITGFGGWFPQRPRA